MSAPTGLLAWGQAGSYQGPDDRAVITALCNQTAGIVKPAVLTAGTGLAVQVGAFLAVVAAGDGTYIVARSAATVIVQETAGPTSGSRIDYLWVDIDPDGASQWTINLRSSVDIAGRLGISLGTITVPQNANLASAFTFAAAPASYNPFPRTGPLGNIASAVGPATQTDCAGAVVTLCSLTVPVVVGRRYRAYGYGFGTQVTNTATNYLGINDGDGTQFRFFTNYNQTANSAAYGIGSFMYTTATGKTATFSYFGFSTAAALRVTANSCQLQVDDIGP
jgi:hypothetical protein